MKIQSLFLCDYMYNSAEILNRFESISLEKLLDAELMNRVDTKFLFHLSELPKILEALVSNYLVLEVNDQRISKYENVYFDTPNHRFYLDHHNKKDHRFKVRYRTYDNTKTTYFEIKERRKFRTDKQRIRVEQVREVLTGVESDLVHKMLGCSVTLQLAINNQYQRITLVNETLKERLTLDLGLVFEKEKHENHIDNLVVAELKQQDLNRRSPVFDVMNQNKIRPFRFSKYCIGTVLLLPKEQVKNNNFKYIIQQLNAYKNAV